MTHWLLAAGFAGMAVAIFFLGWSARIMRVEWRDDRALRAAEARYERHTHRKGDRPALPVAGRLAVEGHSTYAHAAFSGAVDPPWLFAGESAPGWASESAEYELLTQALAIDPTLGGKLHDVHGGPGQDCWCGYVGHDPLTQTATLPASPVEGEPPIDTGEIMAITDRVDAWIAEMAAQGNVDRHTIQAGE